MSDIYFYELVDPVARKCVNLMGVSKVVRRCVVYSFPEVEFVEVFERFYCFKLLDHNGGVSPERLRSLGRQLAKQMPNLCEEAMKHYSSEKHQSSSQLFKRVKSKKRLIAYGRELFGE